MEFEIHTMARFSDDFSGEDYLIARKKYLQHLARIDFSKTTSLLKYFGDSFFHDSEIISLDLVPSKQKINMTLSSIKELEDINSFRKKHGLSAVTSKEYRKAPIRYNCQFQGVSQFRGQFELKEIKTIMDSELHNGNHQGSFRVIISFSEDDEIEFYCRSCVVKVDSHEKIVKYTGGHRKSIPYCSTCRSRLLNKRSIEAFIKKS